jgi:hypothetical protein
LARKKSAGAGSRWPVYSITPRGLDELVPYSRNARDHSDEQVAQLAALIAEFGWTMPILVDEDSEIIAGHGRVLAAHRLGLTEVPVAVATGWTDAQKRAYRIADNRLVELSSWDDNLLKIELGELKGMDVDLTLTGFDISALDRLFALPQVATGDTGLQESPEDDGDEDPDAPTSGRGELLSRVNITIDDPRHEVKIGDHFQLADRHHLLVVVVMKDWGIWSPLLSPGAIFCPYPGPFTPFGSVPDQQMLVMVQPDTYVAGHILDRFAEVHGEDSIRKVSP